MYKQWALKLAFNSVIIHVLQDFMMHNVVHTTTKKPTN